MNTPVVNTDEVVFFSFPSCPLASFFTRIPRVVRLNARKVNNPKAERKEPFKSELTRPARCGRERGIKDREEYLYSVRMVFLISSFYIVFKTTTMVPRPFSIFQQMKQTMTGCRRWSHHTRALLFLIDARRPPVVGSRSPVTTGGGRGTTTTTPRPSHPLTRPRAAINTIICALAYNTVNCSWWRAVFHSFLTG